jgi:metal-responsive CopG/Arc/MetJ family transcriptional regulator
MLSKSKSAKDCNVRVDLPPSLFERIDRYAIKNGIKTRTGAVRELIRLGLAAADKEK